MKAERLMSASERWLNLLLRLYPPDFRDEMGPAVVETYKARIVEALQSGGPLGMIRVWAAALNDSLRNGLGERLRPAISWRRSGNWGDDMGRVIRRFARAPIFLVATVATLTVGLGAFAVVYTAIYKVIIEPMPYRNPDDLYFVWRDYTAYQDLRRGWLGGPDIAELQRVGGAIETAAGMQIAKPTFSLRPDADPFQVTVMLISPNLFGLLGVQPALGRGFEPHEVGPKRPSVIVLTDPLWKRLGGDRSILGSEVWLSGTAYRVIGIMPPDFHFVRHASLGPPAAADAYLPFQFNLAEQDPNNGSFAGLIRAKRGTSPEVAAAAVGAVGRVIDERDHKSRGLKLYPVRLQEDLVAPVRPALFAIGLTGVFLVLVLLVNLASLLLARAVEREPEFAVSRAVGANGIAVVHAIIMEGGLLGLLGGVTGAIVGIWGTRVLVGLAPLDLPRRDLIALDSRIAVAVIAVGLMLGLIAASVPAAWASRVSLSSLIAATSVRGAAGHGRMRRAMLVAQVALCFVLLSTGGLVVRSFERLLRANPGFRPEGVLSFFTVIGPRIFPENSAAFAFQDRVKNALAKLPGVIGVSSTSALPLSAFARQDTITIPGAPGNTGNPDEDRPLVDIIDARPGYTEVIGMRVLTGRAFDEKHDGGLREALVDRHLAEQFFPNGNSIGATIPYRGNSLTIVGVVDQARLYDLHQDGRPQLFMRADDWGYRTPYFVVRTKGDPQSLISEVRSVIRQIDPRVAVADMKTMDEIVTDTLRQPRLSAVLMAGFAFGALMLVAMGLFGVISGSVARRRGELAVRLALGATYGRVIRLVIGDGARVIVIGSLLAVPGVYASGLAIKTTLIGVSPFDAATLFVVVIGLTCVSLSACYLAARRVTQIEPSRMLRDQQ